MSEILRLRGVESVGLTGRPQAIGDIANAEAFVQRTIDKSRIRYDAREREELLSEGLTILYELHEKYNPGVGGRDPDSSRFSGYAAMFLPRRLGDAWHRWHPEHRYITDPDTGERQWSYGRPLLSLDGLSETNGIDTQGAERHLLHARRINAFCHAATLRVPSQHLSRA